LLTRGGSRGALFLTSTGEVEGERGIGSQKAKEEEEGEGGERERSLRRRATSRAKAVSHRTLFISLFLSAATATDRRSMRIGSFEARTGAVNT